MLTPYPSESIDRSHAHLPHRALRSTEQAEVTEEINAIIVIVRGVRWLAIRVMVFAAAYGGTFLVLIPSWLTAGDGEVDLGWLRWLGLVSLAVGGSVAIVVCCRGFRGPGSRHPGPV